MTETGKIMQAVDAVEHDLKHCGYLRKEATEQYLPTLIAEAKRSSLERVVVLRNREEINLLCGALERYADALTKQCERYRAILNEVKDRPDDRLLYAKVAVRCERDARKQYERLKELKSLDVKMQHNDQAQRRRDREASSATET